MRLGLINLDMMDLKTIVGHSGGSTLLVGQGNPDDAVGFAGGCHECASGRFIL